MCKRVTKLRSKLHLNAAHLPCRVPCGVHKAAFGPLSVVRCRCCVCRVDIRLVCTRRCPPLSTALCCGAELLTAERELPAAVRRPAPAVARVVRSPFIQKTVFISALRGSDLRRQAGSCRGTNRPALRLNNGPGSRRAMPRHDRASARRRAAAPVELHFSPRSLSGTTLGPLPHSDQTTRRLTF
jgi:hypothetical protein